MIPFIICFKFVKIRLRHYPCKLSSSISPKIEENNKIVGKGPVGKFFSSEACEKIMKLIDCFMYFDEDLLLDLRLNILDKYVKKFVITEATYLHLSLIHI